SAQDVRIAAHRLAWGKWTHCGQSCVAPDYVLVHRDVQAKLLREIRRVYREFYRIDQDADIVDEGGDDISSSSDFGRIVNVRHCDRLALLLRETKGRIVLGGRVRVADKYVAPTIVLLEDANDPLMEEELLGPILPVICYDTLQEAVDVVNSRGAPLALYVFASNTRAADFVISRTQSGGVCVNDTGVHVAAPTLPFGGTGASGYGYLHGRAGFDELSHLRGVLRRKLRDEAVFGVRYPPFTRGKVNVMRHAWRSGPGQSPLMHVLGTTRAFLQYQLGQGASAL
ncbi:MAG: hypothetical protein MHM6MM_007557, partial [Cercozoa sp. M6MM]